MTQKKKRKKTGSEGGKYLNPPFDPRILKIGAPSLGGSKLERGRIVAAAPNLTTGQIHGVRFLFNPVAVTATHNVNIMSENTLNYAAPNPGTSTQLGVQADIGGVSIDLLYDRTYELWDKKYANTKAGRFGVYSDVLAFYFMLGITQSGAISHSNATVADAGLATADQAWQTLYPTGAMTGADLFWLYIGNKMRFYGVINSLSVTYSHWNHKMVPTRGQISVGMSFQPDPNAQTRTIKRHFKPKQRPSTNLPGSGVH